jgi:hypothetical protein
MSPYRHPSHRRHRFSSTNLCAAVEQEDVLKGKLIFSEYLVYIQFGCTEYNGKETRT